VDPNSNAVGTMLWFNAIDNVIANNIYRNMGSGVHLDSSFRQPVCWTLVRGNRFEDTRQTCITSRFYVNGFERNPAVLPESDVHSWFTVGNVFRSNTCLKAGTAALFNGFDRNRDRYDKMVILDDSGMMMPVIENNVFREVDNGIQISPPVVWPLLRQNSIALTSSEIPEVVGLSGQKMESILIVPEKK